MLTLAFIAPDTLKDSFFEKSGAVLDKLNLLLYEWITDKKYQLLRNSTINLFIIKFAELRLFISKKIKNKNIPVFIKLKLFISKLIKNTILFITLEKLFLFILFISTIVFLYLHSKGFENLRNILFSIIIYDTTTYLFWIYYTYYGESWALFLIVEYICDFIETMKILNIIISVINILLGYFFFMKGTKKVREKESIRFYFAYTSIGIHIIFLCYYLFINSFYEDFVFSTANLNGEYATIFYDMYFQILLFIINGILYTYLLFTIARINKNFIIIYSTSFMIIIYPMIVLNTHISDIFRYNI